MTTTLPTHEEYEARELADFHRQIEELQRAPLADRKAAKADWLNAMMYERYIIEERIEWLFAGNYGYGAMRQAEHIRDNTSKRFNKVAWFGQTIAALEWLCPPREARDAYASLTLEGKRVVDLAVRIAIGRSLEATS